MDKNQLVPLTQIAYVPQHAKGDLNHPDVQFGFVTSLHRDGENAFCRYWSKYHSGLRTLANSELTPIQHLVLYASRSSEEVAAAAKQILDGAQ